MARLDPRNTSRYWHAPGLPAMDLLQADFTTHDYAPHVHDSLVVAVTEVGGSEFKSRGRAHIAHPRALLVFNPSEPHSGRMGGSPRWRYRAFYLARPAIEDLLGALGADRPGYFTSNLVPDQDLVTRFMALHRALDGAPHDALFQREVLVRAFGDLLCRHGQAAPRIPGAPGDAAALAPALELLRERYADSLTLEDMGRAAGLTPFQLIVAFRRRFGLTPHAYLTQWRLRAALRRLQAGQCVVEAALACGFYDQSALNKHFKRSFGMTPLQYVDAHPRRGRAALNSDQ
ncbi:AraC family transcriptional regulator [Pseudorhodoferax aquiterrae]|uniref:AraC family transcriptional regulator n=1 Tax=Pseudorhodoferax aquiterrae TaxID=747304 RepID=A0ABQ3G5G6_9BURK|nr:AraC family transcriptional regulator [Pseudorhodoferax aquiterrae]GHC89332.1 AraC family transcriptional regulator [Pseudorhodoferax aquiterrae]